MNHRGVVRGAKIQVKSLLFAFVILFLCIFCLLEVEDYAIDAVP